MSVEIGQEAPDFELRAHTGEDVRLSQFRGHQPVVLVFDRFTPDDPDAPVSRTDDDLTPFRAGGAEVLGIDVDGVPDDDRWSDAEAWSFPVLSDVSPRGAVARRYGAADEEGRLRRLIVVVDLQGVVVDRFEAPVGDLDRYAEAMSRL